MDCVLGIDGWPFRSVRLRPDDEHAAAAHQRCVCGPAAGVVGRVGAAGVRHRSRIHRPEYVERGTARARVDGRRIGSNRSAADVSPRQEHQPAMGARQPLAVLPVGRDGRHRCVRHRRGFQAYSPAHASRCWSKRHHGAQPGTICCGRRQSGGFHRLRGRANRDLFHRGKGRTERRRRRIDGRGRYSSRGPAAAGLTSKRAGGIGARRRDDGPAVCRR